MSGPGDELPLLDLDVRPLDDRPRTRESRFERLGHIFLAVDPDGSPFTARRTWRHIAADDGDFLQVAFLDAGRSKLAQNGREVFLEQGDFTLIDTARPYTIETPGAFATRTFQFPKSALGLSDADLTPLIGTALRQNHALSAFLIPFLTRLSRDGAHLHPQTRDKLVGEVTAILTTLIRDSLTDMPLDDAARRTLVLRVKAFITANLDRPDLSPELIATAHRISVRYLHKVFASEDTTVSRWIRHARLERCRRELTSRHPREIGVRDLAYTWGFASAAHFSRVFREAYGMTPREWQLATLTRRR